MAVGGLRYGGGAMIDWIDWKVSRDDDGKWMARVVIEGRCVWLNVGYKTANKACYDAREAFARLSK